MNKIYNIIITIIIHIKKGTLGEAFFSSFQLFQYNQSDVYKVEGSEIWEMIAILHLYNPIHSITSTKSYQWVLPHVLPRNK